VSFFPRNSAKLLMQPGAVHGETNGLYAAVLVNTTAKPASGLAISGGASAATKQVQTLRRYRSRNMLNWRGTGQTGG
jgi:hypothetical protein